MGWVAAAIGIAQAGIGIFGANKQKDIDRAQAELQYRDNLEKIRRREFTQRQVLGTGKAFTEATGVLHTGGSSAKGYLDTMAREFRLELDWMKQFAEEARRLGYKRASATRGANVAGAVGAGISTGMSLYGAFGGGSFFGGGTKTGGGSTIPGEGGSKI